MRPTCARTGVDSAGVGSILIYERALGERAWRVGAGGTADQRDLGVAGLPDPLERSA